MCIAIFKPRKTQPDWAAYKRAFKSNPDGWGFAVAKDGKLITQKGTTSFNSFKKKFQRYRAYPALVHFRIRTSGDINDKNCHPFSINEDLCVIHNGILDLELNINKKMSDTWHFVTQVLRPMCEGDSNFPWNHGSSFLGEQFLGTGNKMVFLKATGEHTIWNHDKGHVAPDKHWYSNYSYTNYSRYTGKPVTSASNNWLYNKGTTYTGTGVSSSGKESNPYLNGYSWSDNKYTSHKQEIDEQAKSESERREQLWKESDSKLYGDYSQLDENDKDMLAIDADDPIMAAFKDLGASDFEAASQLAAAGVPIYVLECLIDWDIESLELLWSHYCDRTDDYFNLGGVDLAQH